MDNALELDNLDKIRINKNIDTLRSQNIPYLEHMVRIPINSLTEIISKEEIVNKLLVDYLISSSASLMINENVFAIGDLLNEINKRYQTDELLTIEDKTIIINIINKLYTTLELEEFALKIESVNVYLWTLGFIDSIDSYNKCNIEEINKVLFKYKSIDDLINHSKSRSKEEILSSFDLVTRYYWAIREARKEKSKLDNLNERIVDIQNDTFEIITSYSYDSLSNKSFKIDYSRDDLVFSFEIPSELNFEKLSKNSKELLALKSSDAQTRIVMQDAGKIELSNFDNKINKYIDLFVKSGFDVLGNYIYHSTQLEEKIIHIIVRRGSTSLNTYFVYISGHLIRIDSLIASYIDSSNYYENINSKNTNIDMNILFSIKEKEN